MEPNFSASDVAAAGPTWRMESATRIRQSAWLFAPSRALRNFSAVSESSPSFFLKKSIFANFSLLSEKRSPSSMISPLSNKAAADS